MKLYQLLQQFVAQYYIITDDSDAPLDVRELQSVISIVTRNRDVVRGLDVDTTYAPNITGTS